MPSYLDKKQEVEAVFDLLKALEPPLRCLRRSLQRGLGILATTRQAIHCHRSHFFLHTPPLYNAQ